MNGRLASLDYLRGLSAFGIMVYHYLYWLEGPFSSDQFMGRVGVYGVSIFYVLSGLTLYHVYENSSIGAGFSIRSFFKKRVFRIYPLLWLATICAIIVSKKQPDIYDLFLNLTGLYGFISWDTTFANGAWSIGNELVFYTAFPLILFSCKRSHYLLAGILILAASFHHYFSFHILNPEIGLALQWHDYVNPLNQIFFFVAGCAIGWFTKYKSLSLISSICLLITGVLIFTLSPANGVTSQIIYGWNRWIFTASCLLICLGAYKIDKPLPGRFHSAFKLLGESSYSVYMLHALVFSVSAYIFNFLQRRDFVFSSTSKLIFPLTLTLVLSHFIYNYFEKAFIKLAHERDKISVG